MKTSIQTIPLLATLAVGWASPLFSQEPAYTEEKIYSTRPDPKQERFFGIIGTTGIKARVYPGVVLKVETMMPGSPCAGKFAKQEILTGINGTDLKGLDPFVAMGNALTKAEATDGKMVFDVMFNFSDNTSGTLADVPGWIGYDRDGWIKYGGTGPWGTQNWNLQGFLAAGGKKEGGNAFSCNGGDWSCREGGLIVAAAPIGKIQGNATYVLVGYAAGSATPIVFRLLADGVAVTPTSAIDPQLTGGWQKFSRTYAPADLAKHVGKEITIVCGLGRDAKGTQSSIDDLSLRYFIAP